MKHNPKDIQLTGLKHAKQTICALLEVQDDLLVALKSAEWWLAGMHSDSDGDVITELRDVHSAAWESIDRFRAAIAKAEGK